MVVPPRRVIPIVFLPGIMGSNLRMNAKMQKALKKDNNIAWRPDRKMATSRMFDDSAGERQLQLDPFSTEVDIFEPGEKNTGDPEESSEQRHDNGKIGVKIIVGRNSPLLADDPANMPNGKSKERKAMERGWGEIFYGSYKELLETCEVALNLHHRFGMLSSVIGTDPKKWQCDASTNLAPITEKEFLEAVKDCWFPVHAVGYNWLRSNKDSAKYVRKRIENIMQFYTTAGYQCEKVVIVTHSMGGLVARALVHPKIGAFESCVLGIVHGVMPTVGAPAAYKRMRCGFEEELMGLHPAPKVLGNFGFEVTAVLGNSPGGLELLPSGAYGNGWLKIRQNGVLLCSLPQFGDPYAEIYKLDNGWHRLLNRDWLNPADIDEATFERSCFFLDRARDFHAAINGYFHPTSYAHYGADQTRNSWEEVIWNIDRKYMGWDWSHLEISEDDGKGTMVAKEHARTHPRSVKIGITLAPSTGPGDQTVPCKSSDHQLGKSAFKGVFRQTGYEHQKSFSDKNALDSTLYCLLRIIQTMTWCQRG